MEAVWRGRCRVQDRRLHDCMCGWGILKISPRMVGRSSQEEGLILHINRAKRLSESSWSTGVAKAGWNEGWPDWRSWDWMPLKACPLHYEFVHFTSFWSHGVGAFLSKQTGFNCCSCQCSCRYHIKRAFWLIVFRIKTQALCIDCVHPEYSKDQTVSTPWIQSLAS